MQKLTASSAFTLTQAAAAAHGQESWQRHAAEELWNTVRDIEDARGSFVQSADRLARELADQARRVEAGWQPNSLGIVRSTGSDIDRLCILLGALTERFRRAVRLAATAKVIDDDGFTA